MLTKMLMVLALVLLVIGAGLLVAYADYRDRLRSLKGDFSFSSYLKGKYP